MGVGRCLEKPKLGRVRYRRGSGGHVELGQRIGDVAVDGMFADVQAFRDRLIAQPARNEAQHFQLARGQAGGVAAGMGGGFKRRRQPLPHRVRSRQFEFCVQAGEFRAGAIDLCQRRIGAAQSFQN